MQHASIENLQPNLDPISPPPPRLPASLSNMGSQTRPFVLRRPPTPNDEAWRFDQIPQALLAPGPSNNRFIGKQISFKPEEIILRRGPLTVNRVLAADDPVMFVAASFEGLRSAEFTGKVTTEYMMRLFKEGLWLNGVQYRFYGHSNSQLRGRSCWLRQANNDKELDDRIYQMGELTKIMNIAKRAKRIGLLFSTADIDAQLDPARTADIPDIKIGDELFSDGCGLMSARLAMDLAKKKKITFRNKRYTPTVFQIRYRGYKGVLMLHPQLDRAKQHLAQFRSSMKKFTVTRDITFSVVDYSKPYAFGRLNNDIIVLLSSLGVTNEALLTKQKEYFSWIERADRDVNCAVDFLSCLDNFNLAERVLLQGLDDPKVQKEIKGMQNREVGSFGKKGKTRVRMMIQKSRLLFGVCDPYGVLEEGEVHVRITTHNGPTSVHETDVLVVRNPCLHPGDCLKLRAVYRPELTHLVDCVVFAGKGRRAAPSMTSGGDLDGDKFLICWDPDIVPKRLMKSYDYPPNREHTSAKVTRQDLARHFASYNTSGLAKVAMLHQKWAWSHPEGALCTECLELNALHSQSVDGARVIVPERLLKPPESEQPYIIDLLVKDAEDFTRRFTESRSTEQPTGGIDEEYDSVEDRIINILNMEHPAISEYESFLIAANLARRHKIDLRPYIPLIDFGALTTEQKYAISFALGTRPEEDRYIWNSLFRSDILTVRDLRDRNLDRPLRLQRLYTSREAGTASFFEYLRLASSNYVRKIIILKTDERFAVGIFIRGELPWDEEPEVADNVVVCSFMKHGEEMQSTYQTCTKGFRLHCGDGIFQLYDRHRGNTFIFLNRPPPKSEAFVAASIALQKINARVQKQLGRMRSNPVVEIEIHVVSNRDREAKQLFDLRFDHVSTEEFIKQKLDLRKTYMPNRLSEVEWTEKTEWIKALFEALPQDRGQLLEQRSISDLVAAIKFCQSLHEQDLLFESFKVMIQHDPLPEPETVEVLKIHPPLVFCILKTYPPTEDGSLLPLVQNLLWPMLQTLVRCANGFSMAVLVAFEKTGAALQGLPVHLYCELLEQSSLCIRPTNVVQEVLLVLNDIRMANPANSPSTTYAHKNALGVAFERAEEAADECPCDETGKPTRQRTTPSRVKLHHDEDKENVVKADMRIDLPNSVRLHSLVRLQSASKPEKGWTSPWMMDGIVVHSQKGELKIELMHPPPAEMEQMDWVLYNAGSIANAQAMMDAVTKVSTRGIERCRFSQVITGQRSDLGVSSVASSSTVAREARFAHLNDSQREAVLACRHPLSLIWGPPGTGKTTVVIQILISMLEERGLQPDEHSPEDDEEGNSKLLVTASTHNAVDNILERFVVVNKEMRLMPENEILRVATDVSKVNKKLLEYTVSAQVGDVQQDVKLMSKAQKRVKEATVVFTTCAGAGLGSLRSLDFASVVIDEASQVTEPTSLIPLVKGCKRAVLVGDHVQLRPMVRPMAKTLEYDRSLLERLYTDMTLNIPRTMLDVQYRFPAELAAFPSESFYEGRLRTGTKNTAELLEMLKTSTFPWPIRNGSIVPVVFVPCTTEEDMGGSSKSNEGQAKLTAHIIELLNTPKVQLKGEEDKQEAASSAAPKDKPDDQKEKQDTNEFKVPGITALTPYTKQVKALRAAVPSKYDISSYTIDSFQGRENDVIIFSTVRCNAQEDIGFVEDARRLNVAWTRAKRALIVIGDKRTLATNSTLWRKAIDSCAVVQVKIPDDG